jgi:hypothetical protein
MQTRLYLCSATALGALLFGLPVALPIAAAGAEPTSSTAPLTTGFARHDSTVSGFELKNVLTAKQLEELLAELPIGTGAGSVSPEALSQALAALPTLQALKIAGLESALKTALESAGSGQTLEEALRNPSVLAPQIAKAVEGSLSPLELSLLEGLLGTSLSEGVSQALAGVDDSELLDQLLTSSGTPGQALERLLAAVPESTLEKTLGSNLEGGKVTEQSVEELANGLGMNAGTLAEEVGSTPNELPSTATALTTPLTSGKTLSVFDGKTKAVLGTLSPLLSGEAPGGGSGTGGSGPGGSGGSGSGGGGSAGSGAGGSGGSASTAAGGATVVVNVPGAQSASRSSRRAGHVRVISHQVHGKVATIVLAVPGRGMIVLRNGDIQPIARKVSGTGLVTLHVRLSRQGSAALHRHGDRRLRLSLSVAFAPSHGAVSHAPASVLFK